MNGIIFGILRVKEIRRKVLFTIGILLIYRIGAFIPIPGIDATALKAFFETQQQSSSGFSITGLLDFFSGGAFSNFSIFMLGIMPYISASIILQLLLIVLPSLKKLSQEDGGREKIQQYTRMGTILVCIVQSFTVTVYASQIPGAIILPSIYFRLLSIITVTAGTFLLIWLGNQINGRGIGNGISLIIFAGIVARLPGAVLQLLQKTSLGWLNPVFMFMAFIIFAIVIVLVIYEQQGQRKIPVHYASKVVGRKMYNVPNTYIPFKLNPSGVIPVIFASSVLTFPLQIALSLGSEIAWLQSLANWLNPSGVPYLISMTLLIVFFAYFYTQVSLNPVEIAKNITENGGTIPGIRSDKVAYYLTYILNRIILPGALFLAFIAIIPQIIQQLFTGFPIDVAQLMGGTSLLIMVGVALDFINQVQTQLRSHNYNLEGKSKYSMI